MPLEASLRGCVGVFDSNSDRSALLEPFNADHPLLYSDAAGAIQNNIRLID